MKKLPLFAGVVCVAALSVALMGMGASRKTETPPAGAKGAIGSAMAKDMPVFVDVGSTHCIPCRKMMPTMDALRKEYKGRMAVVFVDVEKERDYALSLGVTMIPTQILYDKAGKEYKRHVGLLTMDEAESLIKNMGL